MASLLETQATVILTTLSRTSLDSEEGFFARLCEGCSLRSGEEPADEGSFRDAAHGERCIHFRLAATGPGEARGAFSADSSLQYVLMVRVNPSSASIRNVSGDIEGPPPKPEPK